MARYEIELLGVPQVRLLGQSPAPFRYDKVLALLAYLAVEAHTPQRRERLAGLLWPEQPERAARHNLSQALFHLRAALAERDAPQPLVLATADTLQANPAADWELDSATFARLVAGCADHQPRPSARCPRCAEQLDRAVALYRGEFLHQLHPADSEPFEEWALLWRERLHQQALGALRTLAAHHEHRRDYLRAQGYLRRLLELEPWREEAHRQLMRVLAANGERGAALAQYERCRHALAEQLGVEPEPETTALYQWLQAGAQAGGHEAAPEPPRPGSPASPQPAGRRAGRGLPAPATPLVGRDAELADLAALLATPGCRLVTLTGPGGSGKTRLALAAAGALPGQDAIFVQLAPLQTAAQIPLAIADAIGVRLSDGSPPLEQLLDRLQERPLLLVLDNLEHLLDAGPPAEAGAGAVSAAGLVAAIIGQTSAVKVLATSRERLALSGEWVVPVDGLGLPPDDSAEAVAAAAAARLFVQSARRANAAFALDDASRPWVARICRLVQGMPLALELAAAWTALLSCAEIAGEIERGLDFLRSTARDVSERHRSVRAAFDHSWRLLGEPERALFRRLSVFRGGFTREAAAAVMGGPGQASPQGPALEALTMLAALATKSLLRPTPAGRYELHELLRQYGEDRLRADPAEERRARAAHCAYYTGFLVAREAALKGRSHQTALAEIAAEVDNIRAAWHWAAASGELGALDATADSIFTYFAGNGRVWEGEALIGSTLALLERAPPAHGLDAHEATLGRLLISSGGFLLRAGQYPRALAQLERSLALLRAHGAWRDVALALNVLAAALHPSGAYADEQRLLEESIALARQTGDSWVAAYSLNDLALATHLCGDTEAAWGLAQESLALFARHGDPRGLAFVLHNLGVLAQARGEYAEAEWLYGESLALRRVNGDPWGVASALGRLGAVAAELGDVGRAGAHLREALQVAMAARLLPAALGTLVELAALLARAGQPERAQQILAVVLRQPALTREERERAGRLRAELPPAPAAGLGRSSLDDLVAALLDAGPVGVGVGRPAEQGP